MKTSTIVAIIIMITIALTLPMAIGIIHLSDNEMLVMRAYHVEPVRPVTQADLDK